MDGQTANVVPAIGAVLAARRRRRPRQRPDHHEAARQRVHRDARHGADHQGLHREPLRRPGGRRPERLRGARLHALRRRSRCRSSCCSRSSLVVWFLLRYTRFGYRIYAVGGDEDVSQALRPPHAPHDHRRARRVLADCAVITGLFLASRLGAGTPTVGTDGGYDLESIAAVVLGGTALAGGRGGVLGTIGGVFILAVLDNTFNQLEVERVPQGRRARGHHHRRRRGLRPAPGAEGMSTENATAARLRDAVTAAAASGFLQGADRHRADLRRCCSILLRLDRDPEPELPRAAGRSWPSSSARRRW